MRREIRIDRDVCMGSGTCSIYAGKTFAQDEVGVAYVVDPEGDSAEKIELAAECCPTGAITIVELPDDESAQEESAQEGAVGS